ncbi:MAG: protein translocase subunit SecF [Actinomycetota bacterium]
MKIRRAFAVFRGEHQFHIDLIGRRRLWFLISGALLAISVVGLLGPGLNLGIDFRGGALLTYANEAGASVEEVQSALEGVGHTEAVVQITGENQVRVRTESLGSDRTEVLEALAGESGIEPFDISVEDIGPKWGQQISRQALIGLLVFLVVVTIYISFRFEWKMAISAIAALFHDLLITAGVYAIVGREVTPETLIAILTILGYSLYDTVVIFDKVQENSESVALISRETYGGMVNISLNQVLMRSVNTSLVVLLPVGALMFLGGETLEGFAFALFVGVLVGTYSSIFVAAPLLALLKEREPRLAEIRDRVARREDLAAVRAEQVPGGEVRDKRELVTAAARSAVSAQVRRRPKKKSRAKRKKR